MEQHRRSYGASALRFETIRRFLSFSLLVALVIAGCGGKAAPTGEWTNEESAEPPPLADESAASSDRPANAPTAAEVAKYLDRQSHLLGRRAARDRLQQIRVRVYASEHELRKHQRFLDEALGEFQPIAVNCGVIRVEVTADEVPDAQTVVEDYAQELKRALAAEYHC